MRKAIMRILVDSEEKVAATEFSIEVQHKGGAVVNLTAVQYTYEDVFEYIKEEYQYDLDYIQKVTIEVVK